MLTVIAAPGQNFDALMTRKQVDCSDVAFNCALLFEKYYYENKADSAKALIAYWETKCGIREPVVRAKILLALRENNFNEKILPGNFLQYLFNYQFRLSDIDQSNYDNYDTNKSYYGFVPPGQAFDNFTVEAANKLIASYSPESIEYLLCEFYGSNQDTIFTKLQSGKYSGSALYKQYNTAVNKYAELPEVHLSWITGIWIPDGDLKTLGLHPDIGFQAGIKIKKMSYDATMSFKFLESPNYYLARRTKSSGTQELTNDFFGGYIGFDVGYDIFSRRGKEVRLLGGIALDGFDAIEEDQNLGIEAESTFTYNLNFGLGYRVFLNNRIYLGLSAKYNIVDYSLNNVVDLTGNAITVHFIVGGLQNVFKTNNLNALHYRWRR